MSVRVGIRAFRLPHDDWADARAIRQLVFVEEQACPPAEEWDAWDATSIHLLLTLGGQSAATARWRPDPEHDGAAKLERFAVLPDARGSGLGTRIVQAAIKDAERAGFAVQTIHAQSHLERFYERLGFVRTGAAFVEAGIPHVPMTRTGDLT